MALGFFFFEPPNGLAVEEIKYQVLETQDPFEIRRYEPFIVAETLTKVISMRLERLASAACSILSPVTIG